VHTARDRFRLEATVTEPDDPTKPRDSTKQNNPTKPNTVVSDPATANDPLVEEQIEQDKYDAESDAQNWSTPVDEPAVVVAETSVARAHTVRHAYVLKATQLIWLLAALLEFLFVMRFILKLMAANPSAGFAVLVYSVTGPFLAPFLGLIPAPAAGGAVLEIATLIAMLVYAVVVWLAIRVIWVVFDEPAII
jgi:uncharacterized membrane protein